MNAVELILSKPHFKFDTQAAKITYKPAIMIVENKDIHKGYIIHFAGMLEEKLKTCFITAHRNKKLIQEKM